SWYHSGSAATVSATAVAASSSMRKLKSSAARTSSIKWRCLASHASGGEASHAALAASIVAHADVRRRPLAAPFQLLQCVGAGRFEQAVSGNGRFEIDDQERFGNEIYDTFQCVIGTAIFSEDTGCFCDRKEPCEYRESAQDEAFALRQELVAPVQ